RTLPWERTLDRRPQTDPPRPWLALMLLRERESTDAVRPLPVWSASADSLLASRPGKVLAPGVPEVLVPEVPEDVRTRHAGQSCRTLDLPAPLFKVLAPRLSDLPYLAHVREVDTGDKEILALNDRGWFSVLIAHRLPIAEERHRAVLISLE